MTWTRRTTNDHNMLYLYKRHPEIIPFQWSPVLANLDAPKSTKSAVLLH